jgi:hypothetical protein
LATTLSWEAAVRPLDAALAALPLARPLRPSTSVGLLGAVGVEYVRRGRDVLAV